MLLLVMILDLYQMPLFYLLKNSEITVTHVHVVGLTITNTIADTDNRPTILQLKSEEDAIVADDVIASIEIDSDGTDAKAAVQTTQSLEPTFSASANATKVSIHNLPIRSCCSVCYC